MADGCWCCVRHAVRVAGGAAGGRHGWGCARQTRSSFMLHVSLLSERDCEVEAVRCTIHHTMLISVTTNNNNVNVHQMHLPFDLGNTSYFNERRHASYGYDQRSIIVCNAP